MYWWDGKHFANIYLELNTHVDRNVRLPTPKGNAAESKAGADGADILSKIGEIGEEVCDVSWFLRCGLG